MKLTGEFILLNLEQRQGVKDKFKYRKAVYSCRFGFGF